MNEKVKHILAAVKHYISTSLRLRDVLTFGLFVLFAMVVWYGHALNSVRETELTVPLSYTGIPEDINFTEPLPSSFSIRLRDAGKRLMTYRDVFRSPIVIDLSDQLKSTEGTVHITNEHLRPKVNDLLQGTTKLQDISPETIDRDYFAEQAKVVKVVLDGQIDAAKQYEISDKIAISPKEVTVFGEQSAIDTISFILTERVDLKDVKDTITEEVVLLSPQGVRLSTSSVSLTAVASQYTERVLSVPVRMADVPRNEHVILFPTTVDVRVRTSIAHYNDITDNDLQAVVDYPRSDEKKLSIRVNAEKDYITIVRITPTEVEYLIEK